MRERERERERQRQRERDRNSDTDREREKVMFAFECPVSQGGYVTNCDKRGTKSPGRSRDNWKKQHLGVSL